MSVEMHDDKEQWRIREKVLQSELKLALHTYQPKVVIESGVGKAQVMSMRTLILLFYMLIDYI